MTGRPNIATLGGLIGDPSWAIMLQTLMDGRARTATELALEAGVAPPTASAHLAKLVDGELLALTKQGRHRYFRIASAEAADTLEALAAFAADRPPPKTPRFPRGEAMRTARTCYDHLAGRLAIAMTDALLSRGELDLVDDVFRVTASGERMLRGFGIDLDALRRAKRPVLRCCLDWSERRPHIGGGLGAALLDRVRDEGWITAGPERAVTLTTRGKAELPRRFGFDWPFE